MRYLIILLLILFCISGYSQTTQLAKGRVFNDINKNGIIDDTEEGIPGVLVSNQEMVTVTDANGYYELPVDEQTIIFITKPAGFEVPLNKMNIPQFYYIHQPEGSPLLEFAGIKKTGSLPSNINFSLYKTAEMDSFRMLALADVQVASEMETEYFRKDVVAPVLSEKYDVVVSLGDMVHDNLDLFPGYIKTMALLKAPVYSVEGNHDVNYDADEPYSNDTFKSYFGPNYYSFDYGQVHFVCLDNVERTCKKGDTGSYWDCYRGYIGEKQLHWLQNDLKHVPQNKLVVICQHIALERNEYTDERNKLNNRKELFDVLQSREKLLVLSGHKHTLQRDFFGASEGWKGKNELQQIICSSVSGSWWTGPKDERGIPSTTQIDGVPNGYFIFDFKGNDFVPNYFPAGNINEQMRIENPTGNISKEDNQIIVNVYNSSKNSVVYAEIDGKKKIQLKNVHAKDPFIAQSFKTFRNDYKSWASPSNSTQLWQAKLPAQLELGLHVVKVIAQDEYNREYISFDVFEVQ